MPKRDILTTKWSFERSLMSRWISLLALLPLLSGYSGGWDVEYWQYINWTQWVQGPHSLFFKGEVRFHRDCSQFYAYKLSEGYAYQALKNLDLEVHYAFIHEKSVGAISFVNTHRFEFEANPSLDLDCGVRLNWRNRLEVIKRENVGHWQFTLRHRAMAEFPIHGCGCLFAYRIYDEIFYHFETNLFSQNRFYPIELAFQLTPKLELNGFLMVRNFFTSAKWHRSIVLGSTLSF